MKKRNKNKNSSIFLEENNNEENSLEKDISQSIDIVNRNREELENQRKDRINKFERTANGQLIERPKYRYNINFKFISMVAIVVIIIVWILYDFGPYFGVHIKPIDTNINSNKIELVSKESDIYGEYNDELFVYSNNSITTYNENSKVTWNYSFSESFTPSIYVTGKYLLVTNDSTGMAYLFEGHNEILNKKIDGIIKKAFLDKFGNVAIEYSANSGYNNIVSVFNKKGDNTYNIFLNQDTIIDMKLLDSAQRIVICEAVTNSSTIGIRFKEVDISKGEEERIRDVISLDNQFVYDFMVQGKDIYVLLDNKIVKIDISTGNTTELKKFDSTQLIFVALNDNYYTVVERDANQEAYNVQNAGYSGNSISNYKLDLVPKNMISTDIVNYYIYQDNVKILNKWGVDLGKRDINFTPKKCVTFNNSKSLALIYTNKIYIINL